MAVITIKDIARLSGYGVSTVSRALNDHPDVNADTKKKIVEIADQYNFQPNANAKHLKQQISNNIIILAKGHFNMFFAGIIEYMQIDISKAGYGVIVHYIEEEDDEVVEAERLYRERKPVGIIMLGGNVENFEQRFADIPIPCVLSTALVRGHKCKNLSCVGIDDIAAGKRAMDYLFEKGHRNIGIIGGNIDVFYTNAMRMRYQGCMESFEAHDRELDRDLYQKAKFSFESAYTAMNELWARRKDITAVFCMSDIMAIGVMRAIRDAGLRVPEDISVIGFDGIELSKYYIPKLTTIVQPQNEIASISVELLISHIERKTHSQEILVGIELREGESVRSV